MAGFRLKPVHLGLVLLLASFGFAYHEVIPKLVSDWATDENYSHGFLIIPIALYLVWERREKVRQAPMRPAALGIVVVLGSLATLVAGILGAELFLTRISIVGLIAGGVLFILGWQHLRVLAFPIAFLVLMIPIPAIVFNQIAFPLQLLASRFGEATLNLFSIPVLREGNVIILANTTLEVAEACSGIRSLVSLLTLGIVYSYFSDRRNWVRTIVTVATIPIAIVTNGLRVAGTGIAAHFYGPEVATGFLHTFSGWLMFVVAFIMLMAIMRVLLVLRPQPHRRVLEVARVA